MITVMCSNYNSEEWIEGYLDSLNMQFLRVFEVIFVDANSTDKSPEIIQNWIPREGISTKFISAGKRISVYEAWNTCIDLSTEEFIINVNTDDRLLPMGLVTMINYALAAPDASVYYGKSLVVQDKNHEEICGMHNWPKAHLHQLLVGGCCCGPFPMVRKEVYDKEGGFDESFEISGDFEMWCRLASRGHQFMCIPEVIGSYYENPVGLSTSEERRSQLIDEDARIRGMYSETAGVV